MISMTKEELKQIRLSMHLTQLQMASLLHLKLRGYSAYEWGEREMDGARAELLRYKIKYGEL